MTEIYEIQRFVGAGKRHQTVRSGITDYTVAVKRLLKFCQLNPENSYRLIKVVVDFISGGA